MKKAIVLFVVVCSFINVVAQASVLKSKVADYISCDKCGGDHDKGDRGDNK
jgi:hypothetical protein